MPVVWHSLNHVPFTHLLLSFSSFMRAASAASSRAETSPAAVPSSILAGGLGPPSDGPATADLSATRRGGEASGESWR